MSEDELKIIVLIGGCLVYLMSNVFVAFLLSLVLLFVVTKIVDIKKAFAL